MGRSLSQPGAIPEAAYYHAASDRHYRLIRRDGRSYLQLALSTQARGIHDGPADLLTGRAGFRGAHVSGSRTLQCHLESTTRRLPYAIRRFGRGALPAAHARTHRS